MAHERVGRNRIRLTQEFLGDMLGVRRESAALAALQSAGFINYARGQITILDRAGLESSSRECYESFMEREWDATMGIPCAAPLRTDYASKATIWFASRWLVQNREPSFASARAANGTRASSSYAPWPFCVTLPMK